MAVNLDAILKMMQVITIIGARENPDKCKWHPVMKNNGI